MSRLVENYKNRIKLSEAVYQKMTGNTLDSTRKLAIAKTLDNTSRFINEALDSGSATQRSAMGEYKRFALALTTVALPTLISFDIVAVSPMSSIAGAVAYK